MLFSTPFFLFLFLPVFFSLYWILPCRRWLLLAGSLIFYGWSEPVFLLVVFASATVDWVLGRWIYRLESGTRRTKALVGLGVAGNLGLLVYAKYTAFAVGNFNVILAHLGMGTLRVPGIALPLGVSFIVFEKITYLVDLYRRTARPSVSLLDYLNYVFLFPKLLAGPIVKYHDIAGQLTGPSHCYEDVRDGLLRFIRGLAKKTLLADVLAPLVDDVFGVRTGQLDCATAWIGLAAFTLQIYFDFSGYSDMAIGLGRILGFRLRENFNTPYLATSFTDFWRRWHISLSSWIKEYLYIPLGGNRQAGLRGYVNLWICFLLSGLWHGAAWNFVIWGAIHGVMLTLDRMFWLRWQGRVPRAMNIIVTQLLVAGSWVFFRCPTFGQAVHFLESLAGAGSPDSGWIFLRNDFTVECAALVAGALLVMAPLFKNFNPGGLPEKWRVPALACSTVLLFLCIGRLALNSFHPFLYFRF